jgi:hypothetical protein
VSIPPRQQQQRAKGTRWWRCRRWSRREQIVERRKLKSSTADWPSVATGVLRVHLPHVAPTLPAVVQSPHTLRGGAHSRHSRARAWAWAWTLLSRLPDAACRSRPPVHIHLEGAPLTSTCPHLQSPRVNATARSVFACASRSERCWHREAVLSSSKHARRCIRRDASRLLRPPTANGLPANVPCGGPPQEMHSTVSQLKLAFVCSPGNEVEGEGDGEVEVVGRPSVCWTATSSVNMLRLKPAIGSRPPRTTTWTFARDPIEHRQSVWKGATGGMLGWDDAVEGESGCLASG